jgi:hypothetical protein
MSKAFNLGSYDDVKKHAAAIYDRIRGIGGAVMPPPTRHDPFVVAGPDFDSRQATRPLLSAQGDSAQTLLIPDFPFVPAAHK